MNARWLIAGALALLPLTSGVAAAQGRGHGRGRQENRGQEKKEEREARFSDHDRELANNWYYHNRRELPPGLRDRDRLPPGLEDKLRPGYVLDRDLQQNAYPAPPNLVRVFPPPPPGGRYMVLGGHVILVDAGFKLFDAIRLHINLAR